MGCATSLVKYLLFFFNLIFVLAGIAFLAIGVILKINIGNYTEAVENVDTHFSLAPTLIIVIGCVVFVIAFFGCCGAIRESTCMLTTYAVILLTIFILQVALGVYTFLQVKDSNQQVQDEIAKSLKPSFDNYVRDDVARESVDSLQYGLQCCGRNGAGDWATIFGNNSLPTSCCPNKIDPCWSSHAFPEGCVSKLYEFLQKSIKTIGIVVIVIAAIELGGAIVALCLSSSIRNYQRRGNYA